MTCPHMGDWTFSVVINPELPQSTLRIMEGKPRMLDLIGVSPTQFRLTEERLTYIEIDRETGAVTVDRDPVEGCTFKSL